MIVCRIIRPNIKDLGCGNGLCVLRRSVWEQISIKMPSLGVCWSKLIEIIVLRTKLQIFFKGTFPDSFWWHTGRWLPSCPEWRELMRWHLWYYIIKMYVTHKIWETIYKNHTISCKGWLPRYETQKTKRKLLDILLAKFCVICSVILNWREKVSAVLQFVTVD